MPLLVNHVADVSSIDELARLLRELRRRQARQRGDAELTYRELAARTGWSIGIIAGYFGGRALPPTDRFDVLIRLLDATPAEQGALATARDRVQENRRRPTVDQRPVPRQLPPAGSRFAGRARLLADLDALLSREAPTGTIAVLSGTAGVGKSTLAVHWAHRVAERFPDGQLYVNLRGFDPGRSPVRPDEAVRGFLDAYGVAAERVPLNPTAQVGLYRSLLAERRVLVILDNARDADQVRPLLPAAPGCLTVVTSRSELSGLVAVEGAHSVLLDLLSLDEARDLMARRLGRARVEAEPEAVDEIVARCARLPLALAIAGARASAHPTFPLAQLAEELRRARGSLDPFTGEDATADARAAFSCSYQYLGTMAATLFRRLGGHPGPDVAAPAVASLVAAPLAQVQPALRELARAHLVAEHTPGRYASHDLLRVFATEQARLDPEPERRAATVRTIDHYLHTAHAAARLLYPHRDPVPLDPAQPGVVPEPLADREAATAWFTAEHRVLVAAVEQAAATGLGAQSWQLAWALGDFLDWQGHWHDLAAVQQVAVGAATNAGGQAHAHRNLARAYNRLGRFADAHRHLDEAIALARTAGDLLTEANSQLNLSLTLERSDQPQAALEHSKLSLELFRTAGHDAGYARSLGVVGWYHALLGDYEQALRHCLDAVDRQREIGDFTALPSTLDSLGFVLHKLDRLGEAATAYQEAIEWYADAGDRFHEADSLRHLGDAYAAAGATTAARSAWRRALDILDDLRHPAAEELRARVASAGG